MDFDMDPFSSVSTSFLAAKAAGNLLSGLASVVAPATSSFRDTFSDLLGSNNQVEEEGTASRVGDEGPKKKDSLSQLAARLQERITQLLSEAGLSSQLGFQLELTPLGSVYVSPDYSSPTPATLDQQLAIESIFNGDEDVKQGLKHWTSLAGEAKLPFSVGK